jgi:energy-coupling factor transporter ATP-binding protein EcfA2
MTFGEGAFAEAPIAAPPPVKPMRINKITLCDFRAFAGPEPVTIDLKGKNLLVYGENGAGKSSIFHALNEFFAFPTTATNAQSRKDKLSNLANKFRQTAKYRVKRDFWYPDGVRNITGSEVEVPLSLAQPAFEDGALEHIETNNTAYVELIFDNSQNPVRWDKNQHPVDTLTSTGSVQHVTNAAFKKIFLDYRSLLETNFKHGDGNINLFDIVVNVLLRDFEISSSAGQTTLVALWHEMQSILDAKQLRSRELASLDALRLSFNGGLRNAIDLLLPKINPLLDAMGWHDVRLNNLTTPGIYYNNAKTKEARKLEGAEITPTITFAKYKPNTPQSFLNEARLSALALAIFFAGREVCAATLQPNTPRIMVLDDVLIGLDQSNRLPVLDVISKQFPSPNWQIILLTHDRVWFEMARMRLQPESDWTSLEMFEGKEPSGGVRPILRPKGSDVISSNLAKARKFHSDHEYAAAAVHARVAFEITLKKLCERKSIPVQFHTEPRKVSSDELLTAVENWLRDASRVAMKALVEQVPRIWTFG